jgi:molybdenum transport protein
MEPAASRTELEKLLADDAPYGDLTTQALGIDHVPGQMNYYARDAMVLAEAESAAALLEIAGCQVSLATTSGATLASGSKILAAEGPAGSLHRGWKVAQTLIEIWSGVATAARAIVDAAAAVSPTVVACTRKNVPGTKSFAVRAVRAGGAVMHRLGLSETVLVFPEHRTFLTEPLAETAMRLRRAAPEKKLVIEVTSVEDAVEAAGAGFDVKQAEKFSPSHIGRIA